MVTRNKKEAPAAQAPTVLSEERLRRYEEQARACAQIDPALYRRYNVKRGLRNEDGSGVLVGLTRVGSVHGYVVDENELVPVPGKQYYRGVDVQELVHGFQKEGRPGFEETAYLLLFGRLPNAAELAFRGKRTVSPTFIEGYFSCPYRNFAERGLLLKEREEQSVRPLDTGNYLHDVLHALADGIGSIGSEEECVAFLHARAEKLLSEPPYVYLKDTRAGGYSAGSLVNETIIVGLNVYRQLKNSEFSVFGAEKTFGYPDSPFASVILEGGEKPVRLAGKIDRIDACGEYMRVVDYKTGAFEVSAKSYYTGRKLQLELYLYAVSRGKKMAGAYYFPARVSFSGEDKDSPFRMQGYTVGDDRVVAMSEKGIEQGAKSRYIDAYFGKKSKKSMTEEDFEDFMEYSVLVARNFVKETRAGCIAPSPYAGACDYCPYGGLCGFDGAPREAGATDSADIVNIVKRRKGK